MEAGLSVAGLSRPGLSMVWLGVDSVSIVMGSLAGDMLPATQNKLFYIDSAHEKHFQTYS